ncbi:unnamed protein product [Onchocerca ochengi]|uniref:Lipase_3 domain-containing protein n=1 Tax=Onchocerca ochengi TaxID=42157 RepID=A0A182EI82_ONCOC|nr:unnamed protein product [Onchocerca ochengi]
MERLLKDSVFNSYGVTFTGHSLGGAVASLAATRTVIQNLRTGDKIKLVSFGQPRTGDYQFAMFHNAHIPFSFRLVHHLDLVPHLPPCKKNKSYSNAKNDKSTPCLTGNNGSPYHHGTEIWYPYGMNKGAKYYECLGKPRSEDFSCSDGLSFNLSHYKIYIRDHRHYFNVDLSSYGKRGCTHAINTSLSTASTSAPEAMNLFQMIKLRINNAINFFKKDHK